MSINTENIPEQICTLKHRTHKQCPDMAERFREVEARVSEEISTIEYSKQRGQSVVPEIAFSDIVANQVDDTTIKAVKRRGRRSGSRCFY